MDFKIGDLRKKNIFRLNLFKRKRIFKLKTIIDIEEMCFMDFKKIDFIEMDFKEKTIMDFEIYFKERDFKDKILMDIHQEDETLIVGYFYTGGYNHFFSSKDRESMSKFLSGLNKMSESASFVFSFLSCVLNWFIFLFWRLCLFPKAKRELIGLDICANVPSGNWVGSYFLTSTYSAIALFCKGSV